MKAQANTAVMQILRSEERGAADHGWLRAKHSFSFANYYNPQRMGFRSLRVINQDVIGAGGGFPMHPHKNMEIFTYMVSGTLAHKDSMGNVEEIRPGQIQLMSAGSGITHSEFNPSQMEAAELLQIWIEPNEVNLTPSYTEWTPRAQQLQQAKALMISPDGRDGSATIHQDAFVYKVQLEEGQKLTHLVESGRGGWLQLIEGEMAVNQAKVVAGDAAFTEQDGVIELTAITDVEALLFDLG